MLLGPPHSPRLPRVPDKSEGLDAIFRYLQDLDRAVTVYISSIVGNAIGMIGVQGLSSSGVTARNFTKGSLAIGNATSAVWSLLSVEADTSYMILYSGTVTTGINLTGLTRTTTSVTFSFSPAVSSGALLDVVLLR